MAKVAASGAALLAECRARAIELLLANLTPEGIQAASPGRKAAARGYTAIFGRDAAVCAIGMAVSGDARLEKAAAGGLLTLARHQAPNGQIPKFVDVHRDEADFWYLGCIDSTLWWLIAIATLDRIEPARKLRRRLAARIRRAIAWLQCQEHPYFGLLQQNEASDWADIMPRSGFVLYTNALWHRVKTLYRLPRRRETRAHANELFHPFGASSAKYRRARLLTHYARRSARHRALYLSFVNFGCFGDEGDAFGNVLALLCGLADARRAGQVLRALDHLGIATGYPVRVVCDPIPEHSALWRSYMTRHRQNLPWQYHNGGIWPFVGAFWVSALAVCGERARAAQELERVAAANRLRGWAFTEWLHGRTLAPRGMRGQSWNAAAFLMAQEALVGARALWSIPD